MGVSLSRLLLSAAGDPAFIRRGMCATERLCGSVRASVCILVILFSKKIIGIWICNYKTYKVELIEAVPTSLLINKRGPVL
jgi:hypothetical protein